MSGAEHARPDEGRRLQAGLLTASTQLMTQAQAPEEHPVGAVWGTTEETTRVGGKLGGAGPKMARDDEEGRGLLCPLVF